MHEAHEKRANLAPQGGLYWTLLGWFVLLGWPFLYTLSDTWGLIAYVCIIVYWILRPRGYFELRVLAWPCRRLGAFLRDFFFEVDPPASAPSPRKVADFVCSACGCTVAEGKDRCDCGADLRKTGRRIPRQTRD